MVSEEKVRGARCTGFPRFSISPRKICVISRSRSSREFFWDSHAPLASRAFFSWSQAGISRKLNWAPLFNFCGEVRVHFLYNPGLSSNGLLLHCDRKVFEKLTTINVQNSMIHTVWTILYGPYCSCWKHKRAVVYSEVKFSVSIGDSKRRGNSLHVENEV